METRDRRPQTVEVTFFADKHHLVPVHREHSSAIIRMADRWQQQFQNVGKHRIRLLIYSPLDALVDHYFPRIDDLTPRIEDEEEPVFDRFATDAQAKAFGLSKGLLAVRPVLGSDHDVMNVRVRREPPVFGAQTIVSAQEVFDHIWRGADAVDTYRVLLSSALDAYLSETSNRLHHVTRTLTTSSATLMSMRLIAGNSGMAVGHAGIALVPSLPVGSQADEGGRPCLVPRLSSYSLAIPCNIMSTMGGPGTRLGTTSSSLLSRLVPHHHDLSVTIISLHQATSIRSPAVACRQGRDIHFGGARRSGSALDPLPCLSLGSHNALLGAARLGKEIFGLPKGPTSRAHL